MCPWVCDVCEFTTTFWKPSVELLEKQEGERERDN